MINCYEKDNYEADPFRDSLGDAFARPRGFGSGLKVRSPVNVQRVRECAVLLVQKAAKLSGKNTPCRQLVMRKAYCQFFHVRPP